jgi:phenylacetate-CoA ligase
MQPDSHRRALELVQQVLPANRFYARKLNGIVPRAFAELPFTTKAELVADQAAHPPYGSNLTFPVERYSRVHQTSGTSTGKPLRWLDTPESWDWVLSCWQARLDFMGLRRGDRLFFPFSFGPFLGFWSAFEAASRAGFLCVPGGGMSSSARLRCLFDHSCTVLFATPTYALHLAEVAAQEGLDLKGGSVRAVVVAGEPGGNVPATRARIETAWGARVFDHYGLTEVGPVAYEADDRPGGMYLLESAFLAECIDPKSGAPVPDGALGELVLTNLGRTGSPLFRYRTGDLVRSAAGELRGGVLGRADDMIHVRGNNVYPTAIEAVVRRFPEVAEFRLKVLTSGPLADLVLEVEPAAGDGRALAEEIAKAIRAELLFRVDVQPAPPGTLPRFEMKAKRVVRA